MLKSYIPACKLVYTICLLLVSLPLVAQTSDDSPQFALEEIIVVGDRAESLLRESTTASHILTEVELRQIPAQNLVDVLEHLPGLTFVQQDASNHLPMAVVRGFFGGGEAENILLIVDGVPLNDLNSGLINWSQVPVSEIQRIEVTRGGGSAVYGDLALGAVINIQTRNQQLRDALSVGLEGGSHNTRGGDFLLQRENNGLALSLGASANQMDGYRDHSEWENYTVTGRADKTLANNARLFGQIRTTFLNQNEPGPLTSDAAAQDDKQSSPLFSADARDRRVIEATAGFRSNPKSGSRVSIDGGLRTFAQEQTRTLQIAPEFGDTQFEDESNLTGWAQMQYQRDMGEHLLVGGIDLEAGSYDSQYFMADQTTALTEGSGNRLKGGLYAEGKFRFTDRLRVTAGARIDALQNRSDILADVNFGQFSPRVGFNYRYLSGNAKGHLYANWSRAFKAPTLDQLYDQRVLDLTALQIGAFNFANADLEPQTSWNYDVGIYQRLPIVENQVFGELTTSFYWLDITNEIDLDLTTFKYGNILESRHRGIESALTLYFSNRVRTHHTYNYSDVTSQAGATEGNMLKHIPKHTATQSINLSMSDNFDVSISQRYFGEVYLDDFNSATLDGFNLLDARLQYQWSSYALQLTVLNLADNHYNSSGYTFFDQASQRDIIFVYPAQGRSLVVSARFTR